MFAALTSSYMYEPVRRLLWSKNGSRFSQTSLARDRTTEPKLRLRRENNLIYKLIHLIQNTLDNDWADP